jgi:hypothetical protein
MDSASLQIVITAVDNASEGLSAVSGQLKEMGAISDNVSAQMSAAMDANTASVDRLTAAFTGADASMGVLAERTAVATGATDANTAAQGRQTEALLTSGGAAEKSSASFSKMGMGTVAAAAVVGYAIDKTVTSYSNLQTGMVKLVTSAGESSKNLGMVTAGVQNIAKVTGTSTTDLGNAMYYVESGGFHAAAGLQVMMAAAKGAKDEQASALSVADATTTILNDYGMKAGQATQAVNGMIASVSRGKTTLQLFSTSLANVLPTAHALGISFAQVGGAIATMTAQGMTAKRASQDLNHAISSLANPTTVQTKMMLQMGLNSQDVAHNLGKEGLTGTLQTLSSAILQNMGPAGMVLQKAMQNPMIAAQDLKLAMAVLPGPVLSLAQQLENGSISWTDYRKAIRALPPGLENLGAQFEATFMQTASLNTQIKAGVPSAMTYNAVMAKMTGGQNGLQVALMLGGAHAKTFQDNVNAVSKAMDTATTKVIGWSNVQGTFNQQWSQLKESLVVFGQQMGKVLIPMLTMMAKGLAVIVLPLSDLVSKFPALSAVILLIVGSFLTLISVAILTSKAFNTIGSGMTILKDSFKILQGVLFGTTQQMEALDAASIANKGSLGGVGMSIGKIGPVAGEAEAAVGSGSTGLIGAIAGIAPELILAGAAIAGITYVMVHNWSTIKKGVDDAVGSVKNFLGLKGTDNVSVNAKTPTMAQSKTAAKGDSKTIAADQKKVLDTEKLLTGQEIALANARYELGTINSSIILQGKQMTADLLKYGPASSQYKDDLAGIGVSYNYQAAAQERVKKAQDAVNKSSSALSKIQGDQAKTLQGLQKAVDALPAAHQRLIATQNILAKAHQNASDKLLLYDTWLKRSGASSAGTEAAYKNLTAANLAVSKAQEGVNGAVKNGQEAMKNAKTWTDQHAAAITQLGLSHAQAKTLIDKLNSDEKDAPAIFQAAQKAADNHRDSILKVGTAHAQAKLSVEPLTNSVNLQNGALQGAKGAADAHKDSIHHLADAATARKGDIDKFNDSLDRGNAKATTGLWGSLKSLFHFASGVTNFQGGLAVVGEQGPELVNLPAGSSVMPAGQTQQIMSNSQSLNSSTPATSTSNNNMPPITLNVQFTGPVMGNSAQAQQQATQIWNALQSISRSHGLQGNLPSIGIRPI